LRKIEILEIKKCFRSFLIIQLINLIIIRQYGINLEDLDGHFNLLSYAEHTPSLR